MKIRKTIDLLDSFIKNPSQGLPEEILLFVSGITPMINVDLLIKNRRHQTLLTWRGNGYHLPGWHIPGGIIRYKETAGDRINAVARIELGTKVRFKKKPLALNEVIHPSRKAHGHYISLLYECALASPPAKGLMYKGGNPKPGEWMWHDKCPDDIIAVHEMYRKFIC